MVSALSIACVGPPTGRRAQGVLPRIVATEGVDEVAMARQIIGFDANLTIVRYLEV